MFKSGRWRSEKNKVKVVFKLQFSASQVPQLNVDGLVVCVVPGDGGKPTVRTDKAPVRDGCCRWENPVYETVKFAQDPKTEKINQKLYQFIVSTTGSAKSGVVGEASVDFAAYAEAIKAPTVSLPLQNSNSKAVLHVSIQRQQAHGDSHREVVECDNAEIQSQNSLRAHLSTDDSGESNKNDTAEDGSISKAAQNAELRRRASIESDSTMSSSESFSGLDTPREDGIRANNHHQENPSLLTYLTHSSMLVKTTSNGCEDPPVSESDWSNGSDQGRKSTDISTNSSQDTLHRKVSLHSSDAEIEKLRSEVVALTRQVDISEMELQTLRKQIVKESKRGQDISRELALLKQERDLLKKECEKLQAFEKRMEAAKSKNRQLEGGDPWVILEEVRQELSYEKDLNSNLRLQLQKTQESNNELLLAVQDLDALLEQKNKETANLSNKVESCKNTEDLRGSSCRSETDEDEDQKALEAIVKEHRDAKDAYLLEQKIMELYNEIDVYKRDKDELETQMEQLALDYEILKQENHDIMYKLEQSQLQEQLKMQYECPSSLINVNELENHVERLEKALEKQSKEFSESLTTIKELETQVRSLEEEIERQARAFESDIEAVTCSKVEQEKRAIQAEEALRKTRRKNADIAERLQDEFRRLSDQMSSTFEANEKMATKAMTEATELRMQNRQLQEMLRKTDEELETLRQKYDGQVHELSEVVSFKSSQIQQIKRDLDTKSMELESQKNHEEEANGALSEEITRLKDEIARLRTDRNSLCEQAAQADKLRVELHETKKLLKEMEILMQRGNIERNQVESSLMELKKEAERSEADLQKALSIKDEKEGELNLLKTELQMLRSQSTDLKQSLSEDEMEKEKLRKQLSQLKSDLKKKEEALGISEKKLKDMNGRPAVHNGVKTNARSNKASPISYGSKEVSSLKEKLKSLEAQIRLKETALETSTNSFLEKEKELKTKIEELESQLEDLNQKSTCECESGCHEKGVRSTSNANTNGFAPEESVSEESGSTIPPNQSNTGADLSSCNGPEASGDENVRNLLAELASLKEQNESMEMDLKDMQERYSEISLKFAEVEGERQKLVMTVRNLKNQRKSQ